MKKWSDFSHEERVESFAKYVKFEVSKYIKGGVKVWEDTKEEAIERMPFNAITGKHYSGINSILLESEAKKRGFEGGAWISQQQAKQAGIKLKGGEEQNAVKVAYIKKFETQIKRDEKGNPITEPQLDKQGNPKINPKTGEPFWKYVYEKIKLDKPILETAYLYHSSQCENLKKITPPTLENNGIDTARPIISDKIGLFPQTKQEIVDYLKRSQDDFLRSQGVQIVRDRGDNGKLVAETLLMDGKMVGVARLFHENGRVKRETPCVDDKYHGVQKYFDEKGNLISETHYEMDKRTLYKEFNEQGKVTKELDFKQIEAELKNGTYAEQEQKREAKAQEQKQEKKQEPKQKRVSPQVRAEQEKKAQKQGRSR